MSLNPRINDTNPTDLYLEWDKDPQAEGYTLIVSNGSRVQVGKGANTGISPWGKVRLGNPPHPVNYSLAPDYPQTFETGTYPVPPPPPPPPPPTGLPRYGGATGFVIQNSSSTDATINAELDKWADIGCEILRVDLLQSAAYLAKFHVIANGCFQRGMKIMACLRGTSGPYGAASAGAFAKAMATEFGSSVAAYEYVNEPNLRGPAYQPAQYGPELAAVYAAIKAVDSKLLVATCGMGWDGAGKFSNWWPGVYNSGGKDHFDLICPHLYDTGPSLPSWTEFFNVYAQYGQGKPVIATEGGAKGAAQTSIIPKFLSDPRVNTMCIYNMMPEVAGFNMFGNPGYGAYKNTPKT